MTLDEIPRLPPWHRYLLVGLVERQHLAERLRLSVAALSTVGPEEGDLPGQPGWTYRRVDRSYYVTHRPSQFALELSASTNNQTVEALFVTLWVAKRRDDEDEPRLPHQWAFQAAANWLPGLGLVARAMTDLHELGGLSGVGAGKYQLGKELKKALKSASEADMALLRAADPAADEEHDEAWRHWLAACAEDPEDRVFLEVHHELSDATVERLVLKLMRQAPSRSTLLALTVAEDRDVEIPAAIVEERLLDLDTLQGDDFTTTLSALARNALRRGICTELAVRRLASCSADARTMKVDFDRSREGLQKALNSDVADGEPVEGLQEVAALLLEYSPNDALPAIRRALREDPAGDLFMAARLVAIGQPWAIREVRAAIPEVDPLKARAMVAALRSRGFEKDADEAALTTPEPTSFMARLAVTLEGLAAGLLTDETLLQTLDDWSARIRDGLPNGFDAN